MPIKAFAIAPSYVPFPPNAVRCYEPHVGVLASECAEISVARVSLTFEVLDALKDIRYYLPKSEVCGTKHGRHVKLCTRAISMNLHELMDSSALFTHESRTPDDFLAAVEQILDKPPS